MPTKTISEAPKIRIPEALLKKLDSEARHFARGAKMSRIQIVSLVIEEWLDARGVKKDAPILRTFADGTQTKSYIPTTLDAFDKTIGGGLVPGSTILLSGFMGVGKSTLLIRVADCVASSTKRPVLYVSSQQGVEGVLVLGQRLSVTNNQVEILADAQGISLEDVLKRADEIKPVLIVLDSLKGMSTRKSTGKPGSTAQGVKVMEAITNYCKHTKTCAIVSNHMTKDNTPVGGTALAHFANTTLVLGFPKKGDNDVPGDPEHPLFGTIRILVVEGKNRNGSAEGKSYWAMTDEGLVAMESS